MTNYRVVAATALAFTIAAPFVSAENWVEYKGTLGPADTLELDADSVKQISDQMFAATWRDRSFLSASVYETSVGQVSCGLRALIVDVHTIPNLFSANQPGVTRDYTKGVEIVGSKSQPLPAEDRVRRYQLPTSGSAGDAMVKAVCERDGEARRSLAINLRTVLSCSKSKAMKSHPLCSGERSFEAAGATMLFRLEQAKDLCHGSDAEAVTILDFILNDTDTGRCGGHDSCLTTLNYDVHDLDQDVARSLDNQKCAGWDSLLGRAAERTKEEVMARDFWKCVTHSIPRLDDHASGADVIASAVFEACASPVASDLRSALRTAAVPKITTLVLGHRTQPARKPVKQQASPSQTL